MRAGAIGHIEVEGKSFGGSIHSYWKSRHKFRVIYLHSCTEIGNSIHHVTQEGTWYECILILIGKNHGHLLIEITLHSKQKVGRSWSNGS